ncbi:hypothetical protein FJO69_01120 [[Mycoplasma] falconis]|uniref:Uncharacterized protein n=1 Tax=[Mycoplasma] falconis TaxID=92403 RepID=A0A501XB19_9BACT|nr:hypothetical protein [[Mycoplasma] falconis]TPE57785.1 hypothetical protein FJO69_01120 [[Mycoplasma] falconis]
MKLKYTLTTQLENSDILNNSVETDWVDYQENIEEEFININFVDQNKMACDLKISKKEIFIAYANQKLHLILNQRKANKLYLDAEKFISLDFFLLDIKINSEEISFKYDILQNDNIITHNIAKMIIKK